MGDRIDDLHFAIVGVLDLDQPEIMGFAVRRLDAINNSFGESEVGADVFGVHIWDGVEIEWKLDSWEFVWPCGGAPGTADGAEAADVDFGGEALGDLVEELRWNVGPLNGGARVCRLHFLRIERVLANSHHLHSEFPPFSLAPNFDFLFFILYHKFY